MLKFFGLNKPSGPIINSNQLNDRIGDVELNEETIIKLFGNLLSQHADTNATTLTENFLFQPVIDKLKDKQQAKIQLNLLNVPFIYLLALAVLKQDYPDYLIVSLAQDFNLDLQSKAQLNYLRNSIQDTTPYFNSELAQQIAINVLDQLKASNEKQSNENHPDKPEEHQPKELQQADAISSPSTSATTSPDTTTPPPPPPLPQGDIKPKICIPTQPPAIEPAIGDKKSLNTRTDFVPPSAADLKNHLKQLGTSQASGYFKFPKNKGPKKHWPDPTAPTHPKPAPTETSTQPPTTGGVDTSSISREQQFAAARTVFSQKAQLLSQRATTLDAFLKPIKTLSKKANPLQDLRINKFTKLTNIADLYMQTIGEEDNLANQLMEKKLAFYQKLGEQERQLTPLDPDASEEGRSTWLKEHQTEIERAQQYQSDTLFQANLFNPFIEEITPILVKMHSNIKENADAQELIKEIKTVIPDIDNLCVDAEDTAPKPTM